MDAPDLSHGAMLRPVAEWFGALGWQIVPTQHHTVRTRAGVTRSGQTPIPGVTGGVPFRTAIQACPNHLRLHHEGGSDTAPPSSFAKPAIRPPETVLGIDVDDGYAGKHGGDTLVNAEMLYGPVPGTWSLTARGPWSPSRRLWFRIPAGLIVKDDFFREHGGSIETIRTGHRYSWSAPAVHVRKGTVVGPVQWYDVDRNVVDMPHVDQLPELPAPWLDAMRDHQAEAVVRDRPAGTAGVAREAVTVDHADAVIAKLTRRLYELHPSGGMFRNAVYGLAWGVARRAAARDPQVAHLAVVTEALDVLAGHPWGITPDPDDEQWTEDGVTAGLRDPWEFIPTVAAEQRERARVAAEGLPRERVITPRVAGLEPATDDEVDAFIASYTRFSRPARLGHRTEWMRSARPEDMFRHARALLCDVLDGYVPADRAIRAIRDVYTAHGGTDSTVIRDLVARALGSILNAKVIR